MSGTHEGGKKAAETIEKNQPGFHEEIGHKGGKSSQSGTNDERINQAHSGTNREQSGQKGDEHSQNSNTNQSGNQERSGMSREEAGRKGGQQSHGGGRSSENQNNED